MSAKLKPDLVFIATAVKTSLLFFQVVDIDPELFTVVQDRRPGASLAGHASKIIETSDLLERPGAIRDGANQRGRIALDPHIGLRIPESDVLEDMAILSVLPAVA